MARSESDARRGIKPFDNRDSFDMHRDQRDVVILRSSGALGRAYFQKGVTHGVR